MPRRFSSLSPNSTTDHTGNSRESGTYSTRAPANGLRNTVRILSGISSLRCAVGPSLIRYSDLQRGDDIRFGLAQSKPLDHEGMSKKIVQIGGSRAFELNTIGLKPSGDRREQIVPQGVVYES